MNNGGLVWDPLLRRHVRPVARVPVFDFDDATLEALTEADVLTQLEDEEAKLVVLRAQLLAQEGRVGALHQRVQVLEARRRPSDAP